MGKRIHVTDLTNIGDKSVVVCGISHNNNYVMLLVVTMAVETLETNASHYISKLFILLLRSFTHHHLLEYYKTICLSIVIHAN